MTVARVRQCINERPSEGAKDGTQDSSRSLPYRVASPDVNDSPAHVFQLAVPGSTLSPILMPSRSVHLDRDLLLGESEVNPV